MNDSKNSSNGLLVISGPASMHSRQLEKLRQTIEPLADELGFRPVALCDGLQVSAVVDYTPLLTRLCDAVEALVRQGEPPQPSEEIAPPVLNQRPSGLNSRPTHTSGCDVVPKEGTFILQRGEKVTPRG